MRLPSLLAPTCVLAGVAFASASASTFLPRLHEGDMRFTSDAHERLYGHPSRARRLGSLRDDHPSIRLWDETRRGGVYVVPYTLRGGENNTLTESEAARIQAELEEMADDLGNVILFERIDEVAVAERPTSYLQIGEFGGGCWSYVGRIEEEFQPQQVNIGTNCIFSSTVQHEMMHALGFLHEQARADRDDYVVVHWDNIAENAVENFEKLADVIDSRGTPYDHGSVMHYSSNAFAVDPQLPTLSADTTLGNSAGMTAMDIIQLRMLYRCAAPRDSYAANCHPLCPCRHGESVCTEDDQCEGDLVCTNALCQNHGENQTSAYTPVLQSRLGYVNPLLIALPVFFSAVFATALVT